MIAFLLYGVLQTVDYAFENPGTGVTGADKLITTNKILAHACCCLFPSSSRSERCPASRKSPGSPGSAPTTRNPRISCSRCRSTPTRYFNLHKDEFIVDADQMTAFRNTRAGAIVNVGAHEEVRLEGRRQIAAAFDHLDQQGRRLAQLDFRHRRHLRRQGPDPGDPAEPRPLCSITSCSTRGAASARARSDGSRSASTIPRSPRPFRARIDALFANSPNETKTQPAKDFAIAFIKQLGDVGFVLRAILGAVFFTLLFLTGNTMMQSVRERIPELAVLKTLGFTRRQGARAGHRRIAAALRAGRDRRAGVELRGDADRRRSGFKGIDSVAWRSAARRRGRRAVWRSSSGCRPRCAPCGSMWSMRSWTSAERGGRGVIECSSSCSR